MIDATAWTWTRRLLVIAVTASMAALASVAGAPATESAAPDGDLAYGEYLSSQCVTCHQVSGHADGGVPAIVGLPTDAFVDALLAYKNGERDNQVMRSVTGALGLEEIAALAAYFAKLSPD